MAGMMFAGFAVRHVDMVGSNVITQLSVFGFFFLSF
jgi:hypothetical protein